MHVDTAFPCSLQEPGLNYEGGWTIDYDGDWPGRVQVTTSAQEYCFTFPTLDLTGTDMSNMGWYC